MPRLSELRAVKLQLEAGVEQLRQQLGEAEAQLADLRAEQRRGRSVDPALQQREELVLALRREIQRRKIAISDLADQIDGVEVAEQQDVLRQLQEKNDAVKGELDLVRRELLKALLGMSGLLRAHQRLADQKLRISSDLARHSGRDYAYENYISCALLHKQDYTSEVQFVVDAVKKMRPVT